MSRYNGTIELVNDVIDFLDTSFGKHYLERLEHLRDDELKAAMSKRLPRDARLTAADRASVYDDELRFFRIATETKSNPTLMNRLAEKLKLRRKEDDSGV
jgi:hypothetical protein